MKFSSNCVAESEGMHKVIREHGVKLCKIHSSEKRLQTDITNIWLDSGSIYKNSLFSWSVHFCSGLCHSLEASLLIGGGSSVTSSPEHKASKKLERICRSKQTGIVILTAEGLGRQRGEAVGVTVKQRTVMLANAHRRDKTGTGILQRFAAFQVQSGQIRINPHRTLHIKLLQSGCRTGDYKSNRISQSKKMKNNEHKNK